jgi:protein TonB
MKGLSSTVLVLALALSMALHFFFLRFVIPKTTPEEEPVKTFEVSLRYEKPPPVRVEQPDRREVRGEAKKVKSPQVEVEEPVPQPEPEITERVIESGMEAEKDPESAGGESAFETVITRGEETGRNDAYEKALFELRSRIIARKIYPQAARRRNIEGEVVVFLRLDQGGELVDLKVRRSSGSTILDKAALSLIEKVIPYEHGLEGGLAVEIPIRYSLTD